MRATSLAGILLGSLTLLALPAPARAAAAEEPSKEDLKRYREAVNKGLTWMARNQAKDGSWSPGAAAGYRPLTFTGLGGMCMLMEGSTVREGKYKDNIRRARDYLMSQSQANGLLGTTGDMYGHGFSFLFLSCVYGEEEEGERRQKLEEILTRAGKFTRDAQSRKTDRKGRPIGGWYYTPAKESGNADEGSVTITQVQALRAARNAGIAVPGEAITEAIDYLEECTTEDGGVIYSLGSGGGRGAGRPALTAAAISCGISAGDYYNNPFVKKWFKFCRQHVPLLGAGNRGGHDEYTHYYYAQAMYMLGDDGWDKLFPGDKDGEKMTWSKYRKATFDNLARSQGTDGSWSGGYVGPVFITAIHLSIMQLDNAALPIYQR